MEAILSLEIKYWEKYKSIQYHLLKAHHDIKILILTLSNLTLLIQMC